MPMPETRREHVEEIENFLGNVYKKFFNWLTGDWMAPDDPELSDDFKKGWDAAINSIEDAYKLYLGELD
jgi:hypothetical protein